ncbi:MAG: LamG domain-containing protein, partial [Planctomycetes bacterium]|nr:LamG domain-containing protein [Planctomycetota bacterium]
MRMLGLDPATGALLYETLHDDMDPDNPAQNIQYRHDSTLSNKRIPVALPDILSCDDDYIYMRAQRFDFQGVRQHIDRYAVTDQTGTGAHIFGSTGFLDDSWFHRTYWIWGKDQTESWAGWMDAARETAAGRILSKDGPSIYGYGRYAKYVTEVAVPGDSSWDAKTCATPIEYRLFGAPLAVSGWIDVLNSIDPSGGLDPQDVPFSVEAWIKVDQAGRDGAIVARGGTSHGYALYLEGGVPTFAVRVNNGTLNKVVASEAVPVGQWVHVAGVLTATPQVKVYINGAPKGTAAADGFIQDDPGDEMEIGTELDSSGGDYTTPYPFNGGIDEVRLYINRALSDAEVAAHYTNPAGIANPDTGLVLYYPFSDGTATDLSGNGHDGAKNGALATITGKVGNALQFTNSGSGAPGTYYWERDIPLHVRAMAKIGDKLVIAGPANVVDTEYAFDHYGDRRMQARLRQQVLAIDGKLGALMHVVSCATGETISECRLSVTPTFDGMAVIGGKLYISMTDGTILCYEGM